MGEKCGKEESGEACSTRHMAPGGFIQHFPGGGCNMGLRGEACWSLCGGVSAAFTRSALKSPWREIVSFRTSLVGVIHGFRGRDSISFLEV